MTTVLVLDHGSGNLRSVCRAMSAAGATVVLGSSPDDVARADAMVLPGVGAFDACMNGLKKVGGDDLVREHLAAERPLLGICVGHQMLFERGIEHGIDAAGLGVLEGVVERVPAQRLPHMGWNTVSAAAGTHLLRGLDGQHFYFVHTYGVLVRGARTGISTTRHEDAHIVAAVEHGWVSSTQFHPEKSGFAGHELLVNWLRAGRTELG